MVRNGAVECRGMCNLTRGTLLMLMDSKLITFVNKEKLIISLDGDSNNIERKC
jgi:hypothetical protein